MNYAAMIEEKNLKKTFIIATLCSTLIGTFTSSMGLWDRVKDKRQQTKRDTEQDKEIKELRKQVEDSERQQNNRNQNPNPNQQNEPQDQNQQHQQYHHHHQRRCCSGSRYRSPPRRRREDEVAYALERSGALIGREFDEGYERLGRRFAIGDTITENRLQAQIIALQQTVINVLQDALYNGRQLDNADMSKLIAASNAARDGSLDALRQQRQRQTLAIESPAPVVAPAVPSAPPAVQFALPRRAATTLTETNPPLFCRYSLDLQYVHNKPLARTFAPGGDCRCPACGVRVRAESDDFWEIEKRARGRTRDGRRGSSTEVVLDEREFHIGQRFAVKCHTPDGEFACVLCNRFRDKDVICLTVDQLINHVGRDHTIDELEREEDFEMRSRMRPLRKALPAP